MDCESKLLNWPNIGNEVLVHVGKYNGKYNGRSTKTTYPVVRWNCRVAERHKDRNRALIGLVRDSTETQSSL